MAANERTDTRLAVERATVPRPGEPGYMGYLAELSAWFGSTEEAFQWARRHPRRPPWTRR